MRGSKVPESPAHSGRGPVCHRREPWQRVRLLVGNAASTPAPSPPRQGLLESGAREGAGGEGGREP